MKTKAEDLREIRKVLSEILNYAQKVSMLMALIKYLSIERSSENEKKLGEKLFAVRAFKLVGAAEVHLGIFAARFSGKYVYTTARAFSGMKRV